MCIRDSRISNHGHPFELVGLKEVVVAVKQIHTDNPAFDDMDTVSLYVGPRNQPEWYDYVVSLQPKRVIFNPGTENDEFVALLTQNGIEAQEACTLVLLSIDAY